MAADSTNLAAGYRERIWCELEEKNILDGYTRDRLQSFQANWIGSLKEPEVGDSCKVMGWDLSELYKSLV